jgi:hypothetical protein
LPQPDSAEELAQELENSGFVIREIDDNGCPQLIPIDPVLVGTALLNRWSWHYPPFDHRRTTSPGASVPDIIETAKRLAQRLLRDAPAHRDEAQGFRYLNGEDTISNFIAASIDQADAVFGLTAAQWTSNLPLIWAAIQRRLRSGLHYRRIAGETTIVSFGHAINKRDVLDVGVQLRATLASRLSEVYYLLKAKGRYSAIVFNEAQLESRREATFIDNQALLHPLRERAEYLWETSVPAALIFDFMEGIKEEYLAKVRAELGQTVELIAARIFDRGVFTELDDVEPTERTLAIQTLADHGWTVPFSLPIGPFPFIANVVEPLRAFLADRVPQKEYD